MDWSALSTFKVHELGSTALREVSLANNAKTKRALDDKISAAFGGLPVLSVYREDHTKVDSDLSVVFLAQGAVLEAVLANKVRILRGIQFYWVISEEQRRQWTQEFRSHVSYESKMKGEQARTLFTQSKVSVSELASIWDLADFDKDNKLNMVEFLVAKYLIWAREQGQAVPSNVPQSLMASISPSPQLNPAIIVPQPTKRKSSQSVSDGPFGVSQTALAPTPILLPPIPVGAELSPKVSPRNARPVPILRPPNEPLSPVPESPTANKDLLVNQSTEVVSPLKLDNGTNNGDAPKVSSLWTPSKSAWNAYAKMFAERNTDGYLTGSTALELFSRAGLDRTLLARIWNLADLDKDNMLNDNEFMIAMHLIMISMKGYELPLLTPIELVHNIETGIRVSPKKKARPPSVRHHRQSSLPLAHSPDSNSPVISPLMPIKFPDMHQNPAPLSNSSPFDQVQPNFARFAPPTAQPFDLGPFKLPNLAAPKPDIIQGIAANIRAQMPITQGNQISPGGSGFSTPTIPPKAHDLVAGAEKSLVGVYKFETAQVKRETLLGGGTFASVWKGTVAGEIVAIKDMSYRSDKEIDMWKREVQLLAHLQNYNYLVKIKGYLVSKEHLSIVMEFMDGGSLFDIIHKTGNVKWSMLQKARILRHIAKGIDSIHREAIVHRDLKSMNVLLDSKGVAKIADLGCSRFLREETMTIGIGSPLWMSPEVQKGGSYNYNADVFSYGVICYEVFNELLPDYDVEQRMVVIPEDCIGYAIIRECIHRNPSRRPSAAQLIESMDLLITSFTSTVAKVVLANYTGDPKELPKVDDVSGWYNALLAYDRQTFDVLLTSGS